MAKTGLVGGSYTTQSIKADSSRTINWYPEQIESGRGLSGAALYPTPGLSVFCTIGSGPWRGSHYINGRLICVSGNKVYEVDRVGSTTLLGIVDNDLRQCSISSNTYQTLIISAGKGYIIQAGALAIITDADFPGNINGVRALKGDYVDGYFFVLADNNTFSISALNDGTAWAAIDTSAIEVSANKLQSMIMDHKLVYVAGSRIIQPLYNSGNPAFPFDPVPSGVIEKGISAPDTFAKLDNTFMFLVEDDRGAGTVARISGFLPQRVSDHGIEHQIQRAIKAGVAINNSVAWSYQTEGHEFYMLNIPGMETTPCYDTITKLWHERAWWNQAQGKYEAHRGINHVYAFDKHLVGDRELGLLYEMDIETYTDNGAIIRRLRRHPQISAGGKRVPHNRLQIFMDTGVGLDVASTAAGYDPQLTLQYSDDAGKTFTNEQSVSIGKIGEWMADVEFRGLGSTEVSRVYQLIGTDPVPYRLMESYLDVG